MLFIKNLSAEETQTLQNMKQHHPNPAPRMRAHAILLNDAGFSLSQLSAVFGVCRQTAATWLKQWETGGIAALLNKPRSGRPRKLTGESRQDALDQIAASPRSLKTVLAQLAEKWHTSVSIASLKRLCHQTGLSWKRVRKSLKSKRDADRFAEAQQQLAGLAEQAGRQAIDLFFLTNPVSRSNPASPMLGSP
ncbi:MAG: helix-turn-helix domain-containing protein [Methylovulum sp.]|nr:helix-turn-helix domain-containing protein [Methylovulum sp.]